MVNQKKYQAKIDAIAQAVFKDCVGAFERFTKACPGEDITAFALCTVDDAVPPYIMGATKKDYFGIACADPATDFDGFSCEPGDWQWGDSAYQQTNGYQCYGPIEKVLNDENLEEVAQEVSFRGMVEGLKLFDGSGRFKGTLPRDQMVLTLWVHDPGNPEWVVEWASETNPPAVAKWFKEVYPY